MGFCISVSSIDMKFALIGLILVVGLNCAQAGAYSRAFNEPLTSKREFYKTQGEKLGEEKEEETKAPADYEKKTDEEESEEDQEGLKNVEKPKEEQVKNGNEQKEKKVDIKPENEYVQENNQVTPEVTAEPPRPEPEIDPRKCKIENLDKKSSVPFAEPTRPFAEPSFQSLSVWPSYNTWPKPGWPHSNDYWPGQPWFKKFVAEPIYIQKQPIVKYVQQPVYVKQPVQIYKQPVIHKNHQLHVHKKPPIIGSIDKGEYYEKQSNKK